MVNTASIAIEPFMLAWKSTCMHESANIWLSGCRNSVILGAGRVSISGVPVPCNDAQQKHSQFFYLTTVAFFGALRKNSVTDKTCGGKIVTPVNSASYSPLTFRRRKKVCPS